MRLQFKQKIISFDTATNCNLTTFPTANREGPRPASRWFGGRGPVGRRHQDALVLLSEPHGGGGGGQASSRGGGEAEASGRLGRVSSHQELLPGWQLCEKLVVER